MSAFTTLMRKDDKSVRIDVREMDIESQRERDPYSRQWKRNIVAFAKAGDAAGLAGLGFEPWSAPEKDDEVSFSEGFSTGLSRVVGM